MRPWIAAIIVVCLGPAAAVAQSPHEICVVNPPSFVPTDTNRVSCEELASIRAKKTLVIQRQVRRNPHCESRIFFPPDRGDGSFAMICEVRCAAQGSSPGHSWIPCTSGRRSTGVATCTGSIVCSRALDVREGGESCTSYHRQGNQYAVRWVSGGRSCAEGDVSFIDR